MSDLRAPRAGPSRPALRARPGAAACRVSSSKPLLAPGDARPRPERRRSRSARRGARSKARRGRRRRRSRAPSRGPARSESEGGNFAPREIAQVLANARELLGIVLGATPENQVGSPPRENWIASAVPQEPAPQHDDRTHQRPLGSSVRVPAVPDVPPAPAARRSNSASKLTMRQQERREAALRHDVRHGLPDVREQDVRREGAEDAARLVGAEAAHAGIRPPA